MTEKYLVAATVCYTDPNKRNINLRYTTQMPNIRGFGPLMALIFGPAMQVKCNKENTHYTAFRTGLGYDDAKGRPMFAEHDMVFNLNVEITQHDIELVRWSISFSIFINFNSVLCVGRSIKFVIVSTHYSFRTLDKRKQINWVRTPNGKFC